MVRLLLATVLALSCVACTHLSPLPQPVAEATVARVDAAPAEREATITVTLSAQRSELEALLRDQLSLPSAPEWQRVSEPDKSPELDIRYEAELLPPQIELQGQTLVLKLQVAYFGALRARVHTPFGWLRVTKGTSWGDAEHRGLIEVDIHTTLALGEDYQLHAQSVLHDVRLTAPPIASLCAGGAFKVCVPAEVAARPIHDELERRIRARVDAGLAQVDQQVRERSSLTRFAQRLWEGLHGTGQALPDGARLSLRPRALSLGFPAMEGDQLVIALGIRAAPLFQGEPAEAVAPLPPLRVESPGPTTIALTWLEPFDAISSGLSAKLSPASGDRPESSPTRLALLGPAASEGRFVVALGLEREGQVRSAYGEASLLAVADSLKLDGLRLTPDSERLLALAKIDQATFLAVASSASYRPSAALDARIQSLRSLIAESLAPLPIDPLAHVQARIVSARAAQGGLLLEAELR
jgi:hypothetical protein